MNTLADLQYTEHAQQRMAQRGISMGDVEYVFEHGHCVRAAGAQHRVLRQIDIPKSDTREKDRLNGTVVTLDKKGNTVITVYRNHNAPKALRTKPKWSWH